MNDIFISENLIGLSDVGIDLIKGIDSEYKKKMLRYFHKINNSSEETKEMAEKFLHVLFKE